MTGCIERWFVNVRNTVYRHSYPLTSPNLTSPSARIGSTASPLHINDLPKIFRQ